MGIAESVGHVLGNYATFTGRARRSEYWWWYLALVAIGFVFAIAAGILGSGVIGDLLWLAYTVFWLAVLVPTLAVAVRRLHDTDRSGWWILTGLIPFVGWIILLVLLILPGTPGSNQYGSSPA